MSELKFPTEQIELPSKGLIYPKDHPLSSGQIEMKYMTAREEDILTNQSFIQKGLVLDKLLEALIVNKKIKLDDIILGDKNAILIAARILGYGKDYEFMYANEKHTVDLSQLDNKELNEKLYKNGNKFDFQFPHSKVDITFQLLDGHIEKQIENEIKGLKKINKNSSPTSTTRLKHIITSVDGDETGKRIREFVDNYLLAKDARALREHIVEISPDIKLLWELETDEGELVEVDIPLSVNFFFPDF
ncbi:MAG: hypothetical protein GY777_16255 [Candidatus Brocadiaceae bacterium]|nr:hypothetical protein [Candidatus Brocadiaceae bacterium]